MTELAEMKQTPHARAAATPSGKALSAALAVLVLAAIAGYAWQQRTTGAMLYATEAVSRGSIVQTVLSSGMVNPVTTIQVGTYVSGVIQSVNCDFNTRVKAGQLCAKIDPRPYQTVVDQDVAALATARAQLTKDQANLAYITLVDGRNRDLLGRGMVSQEAADTSRNAYLQAKAQLELDTATATQRAAQLSAARINLGYTDIVSPVDGTVVARNVTQGQTVAASFQTPTLFLIAADLAKMQVDTNVSEADIGRIAVGNAASFTVPAYPERQFGGKVEQIRLAPQTVQNVVTYDVVVGVANPDLALRPGMTAAMRIDTRRLEHVLRVPAQALRYHPTGRAGRAPAPGAQVWILAGGQPQRVAVRSGLEDDNYAQISGGGLREGDPVILSESGTADGASPPRAAGLAPLRR